MLREAAKLMGLLFVGRREAKAVFTNGQWIALREKFSLSDFRTHLFGDRCLGAYLLDANSMVRCIAFDVDLKPDSDYFIIADISPQGASATGDQAVGELDLDIQHHGDLEAALHDETNPAHRWACSLVHSTVRFIAKEVGDSLGLASTTIITGGGAHVFVPFGELVPAGEARAMAHSVMDGIPLFKRTSESFYSNGTGLDIEVFPKQDSLADPDSLGNLIRLPFGMHERGIRTYALDPQIPSIPSWRLRKCNSMDALRLQAAAVNLEWEVVE
jgi:hypothetical protein